MADLHSLDIVSRIDFAELDNAINNAKKVIATRFDFKNVKAEITVDKKEKKLQLYTADGKMNALKEVLTTAIVKRGMSIKAFTWGDVLPGADAGVKCEVKVLSGLEQEVAKKIVKLVKESGMKVQTSIQGDEVRLSGKQIDDLRSVMALLTKSDFEVPLQFLNMK